ncbi:MAG: hypothetical protein KAJ40_04775 [Alphaproteobacteria bacterium]|nr:hypothetical protein [Alphaproteobacteria bacterium]
MSEQDDRKDNTKEELPKKQGYQFGFFSFLGLIVVVICLLIFTPLSSGLIYITPNSVQKAILSPLYRNVFLSAEPTTFDKPFKMPIPAPGTLPVLGFDSGICFSFPSTINEPDPDYIDVKHLEAAQRNTPIAEIIAIGAQDKYEYKLESITYRELADINGKTTVIICQKFGRNYASTPKEISSLYIRPLTTFTAHKTVWNSTKHLYNNDMYSPLDVFYQRP